jgi:metallo-beta-lactamase family protein
LQDGLRKIRIYHEEIDVEAEVFTVEGYSAHGDQNDILSWMKSIRSPLSNVFVNHGEEKSSQTLAQVIQNSFACSAIVPKLGDEFKL